MPEPELDHADAKSEPDADAIARQIANTPSLRAQFFEDATEAISEVVPSKRPIGLGVDPDMERLRKQVRRKVPGMMKGAEAKSSVHAAAVMQQFFQGAIRNPERSFFWILVLSIATFVAGLGLIVAGLVMGFVSGDGTRDTIVAAVFSAGGVAGVLGSVFTLARRGVSLANANHAQIRLILTAFATELGHLRAHDLNELSDIEEVNNKIREAMQAAVGLIQTHVKVDPSVAGKKIAVTPPAPGDSGGKVEAGTGA